MISNLQKTRDNFEDVWTETLEHRDEINRMIRVSGIDSYGIVDGIESPENGRGARRVQLRQIEDVVENRAEAAKVYWQEYYVSAFDGLIENLKVRLTSDLLKTLVEFEMIAVDLVGAPNLDFSIENIERHYGKQTNKDGAPFGNEFTKENIKTEMQFVHNEWIKLRGNNNKPRHLDDVISMTQQSFEHSTPLNAWEYQAGNFLKILYISAAIAATSALAERSFSLARRLKSYLRSHMKDDKFFNLGILAFHDRKELEKIIDLVDIGNKYIQAKPGSRNTYFGTKFTSEDFIPRQFEHK